MLEIIMEYSKGVLFVRLHGSLNKISSEKFINDVIPVILKHELKYVVINLDELISLDTYGIEALMCVDRITNDFEGKTTLCSLTNKQVKERIKEHEKYSSFYETSNELTALNLINI